MSNPRIYRQHLAQREIERCVGLIELELKLGTHRRHLDPLVDLATLHLEQAGDSLLVDSLRAQIAAARSRILQRDQRRTFPQTPRKPSAPPSLRVVK